MKLIRLTDDRYLLDVGPKATSEFTERARLAWNEWWESYPKDDHPTAFVIGGSEYLVEYEDRRDSDIEIRLKRLEDHIHVTFLDRSGPPLQKEDL